MENIYSWWKLDQIEQKFFFQIESETLSCIGIFVRKLFNQKTINDLSKQNAWYNFNRFCGKTCAKQ